MNIHARPYHDATDLAHMRHMLMAGRQANISALRNEHAHPPNDYDHNHRNLNDELGGRRSANGCLPSKAILASAAR
jgi:hypothetical protein